jgi:GAF domain-containing protein
MSGLPDAAAHLATPLAGALALDPAARTPSASELAAALGDGTMERRGVSLAASVEDAPASRPLLEAIVRTAAGVFDAAASSIALTTDDGSTRYVAAWGAGADEIVGVVLPAGTGVVGSVIADAKAEAIEACRSDGRFAAAVARRTGYVPHTMLLVPLLADGRAIGALTVLDRRDARPYSVADIPAAALFADLSIAALR